MDLQAKQQILEVASSGASKTIAGGATAALYGGYTATEIAAFGGLLIAFIGILWKFYVDNQLLKIARERQLEDTKFREKEVEDRRELKKAYSQHQEKPNNVVGE